MPPTQSKNRAKNTAKSDFCRFSTFSVRFGPFLTSWRPGTCLKSFLEAIRFFSTVYEPVATLKTSNRLNFHDFSSPIARPTFRKPNIFRKSRSHIGPQAQPPGGKVPQMDSLVTTSSSKSSIFNVFYHRSGHFSCKSTFSFPGF